MDVYMPDNAVGKMNLRAQVVISRETIDCKQQHVPRDQSVNGIVCLCLQKQRDRN
jgi:hypothetical protein